MRSHCLLLLLVCASCKTPQKTINKKEDHTLTTLTNLNKELAETSGLESYENLLITHNDSGDDPTLYFIDTNGTIKNRTTFKNMTAIDWEDITKNSTHLFIADTGNNLGNRKDLKIYQIPLTEVYNKGVVPQIINFSFPDQVDHSINNQQHSYDAESIIATNDELHIFSKDWRNLTTSIYTAHINNPTPVFEKKQTLEIKGLITGATHNGTDKIVLCGYNSILEPFIAIIKHRSNKLELIKRIDLPINSAQIEAITYSHTKGNNEIYYLSSEAVNMTLGNDELKSNGQLYKLQLTREY